MFQKYYKHVIYLLKCNSLPHLARKICLGAFIRRVAEHCFGVAILDKLAQVHEHGF